MRATILILVIMAFLAQGPKALVLAANGCCAKDTCKCVSGVCCVKGECKCKGQTCCANGVCKCGQAGCDGCKCS